MTHGKRLSYSNSAVFADTVVPSRYHCTIIRWLHDGIARTSRSRVAFLRQSGQLPVSFVLSSWSENNRWHRWSHKVKMKMTRCPHNGHTNSTRKWTFARSFGKDFATAHEVAAGALSEPSWNISFIVCPSGVNFGTVRQEHNNYKLTYLDSGLLNEPNCSDIFTGISRHITCIFSRLLSQKSKCGTIGNNMHWLFSTIRFNQLIRFFPNI